ncbi:hypothetical protein MCOR25_004397 [Pyricularia grisea]|nr:hypothetical protein MCOR25_004397 [Pyricularia grisea]
MSDSYSDSDFEEGPLQQQRKLPKPEYPYRAGTILQIRRHIPPPPRGVYYRRNRQKPPKSIFLQGGQELVATTAGSDVDDPEAREGKSLSDVDELQIIEKIRGGIGYAAQLVVCRRQGSDETCVAKFFDPLYANGSTRYRADDPHSWGINMDLDYSNEAACYQELNPSLGGSVVPRYYGSWTTTFPIETDKGPAIRVVALILLEHIHGVSLHKAELKHLSPAQCLDITARILHCETLICSRGVEHLDLAPRNILVCDVHLAGTQPQDPGSGPPRVVILDFARSKVRHLSALRLGHPNVHIPVDFETPMSPIECSWWWPPFDINEFGDDLFPGLLVPGLECSRMLDTAKWRTWLWDTFGGSSRYLPPPPDMSCADVGSEEGPGEYMLRHWEEKEKTRHDC